jgi:hypothetical protein
MTEYEAWQVYGGVLPQELQQVLQDAENDS